MSVAYMVGGVCAGAVLRRERALPGRGRHGRGGRRGEHGAAAQPLRRAAAAAPARRSPAALRRCR